jgi:hypothetical protein
MTRIRLARTSESLIGGEHTEYLSKATHSALDAIHSVHGDGGMPDVSVSVNPYLKIDLGMYHGIKGQWVGHSIELKVDSPDTAFTMAHELGHFLDQWGFDTDGYGEASVDGGSPMARPIMDALFATPEAKAVIRQAKTAKGPARSRFVELALPSEFFARAYAQYVAIRSSHPDLMAGLESRRRGKFNGTPDQWSDSSFAAIAEAFDQYFGKKGWKR